MIENLYLFYALKISLKLLFDIYCGKLVNIAPLEYLLSIHKLKQLLYRNLVQIPGLKG